MRVGRTLLFTERTKFNEGTEERTNGDERRLGPVHARRAPARAWSEAFLFRVRESLLVRCLVHGVPSLVPEGGDEDQEDRERCSRSSRRPGADRSSDIVAAALRNRRHAKQVVHGDFDDGFRDAGLGLNEEAFDRSPSSECRAPSGRLCDRRGRLFQAAASARIRSARRDWPFPVRRGHWCDAHRAG